MKDYLAELSDINIIFELLYLDGLAYVITVFIILYAAKLMYDLFTPFSISEQLTTADNKAVAVSFSGYMLGVMLILLGIFKSGTVVEGGIESRLDLARDLLATVIWGLVGIVLLNVSRIFNDKLLLYKFDNVKELVQDKNIGTAAVLWGSYIGSALIVKAAVYGETQGWLIDITGSVIFFLAGQIAFVVYGWLYQKIHRYDVHDEIEKDNVSAGVAFGLSLTAMGILLSGYLMENLSLVGFVLWFILAVFILLVTRYIVDKLILPGALLDEEVTRDQNWGASLLEGSIAVGLAFLLVAAIL